MAFNDKTTILYVVQHCWYAGPHISTPPVDYLRLLPTLRDAEQVAYASAHWWSSHQHTTGAAAPVVRTIQLPKQRTHLNFASAGLTMLDATSNAATSIPTSLYGFVTSGRLFWVRPVMATATAPAASYGEAHCIITGGLLGGTSNSSTHPAASLIFVGPQSSHAALRLIAGSSSHVPPGSTVQWVPVGPPPSLDQLAQEWPHSTIVPAARSHDEDCLMDDSSSSKRVGSHDAENEWFNHAVARKSVPSLLRSTSDCDKEHRLLDQPWPAAAAAAAPSYAQPRPAKRACRPVPDNYCTMNNLVVSNSGNTMEH